MKNRDAIFRPFGKKDVCFLALLAAALIAGLLVFYRLESDEAGSLVVVTVDGEEFGRYSLSVDQTVEITDAGGRVTNVLAISGGYADMTEADCPDRLCVRQNRISKNRQNIVCLPNKVVVTVEAAEESGIDAIAN